MRILRYKSMTGRGYKGMNGEGGGAGWRVKGGLRDERWGVRNVPLISLNAKLIISRNYENDNFRSHPTQRSRVLVMSHHKSFTILHISRNIKCWKSSFTKRFFLFKTLFVLFLIVYHFIIYQFIILRMFFGAFWLFFCKFCLA